MTKKEFEALLDAVTQKLSQEAVQKPFDTSKNFENRVREVLRDIGKQVVNFDPHPYVFPDIVIGEFGVEVKFTTNDTWRSVANSVFESTRDANVKEIYLIFGKMGGSPEVKWGKYEDCVMHVRTSHVPRFEVEIGSSKSLFQQMGIDYEPFRVSSLEEKMKHIREYARKRLKEGEHLWWLEDKPDDNHALELNVKLFKNLKADEQRKLRAEAAFLCPQIVSRGTGGAGKSKYDDALMYMLTRYGVIATRDSFSAGSALGKTPNEGGDYVMKGLKEIEPEMREAAANLEDALFVEYWDKYEANSCKPENRIAEWLRRADSFAKDWRPSETLFVAKTSVLK